MKPSKRFEKMSKMYRRFAERSVQLAPWAKKRPSVVFDFSEEAKEKMFLWESYGKGNLRFNIFSHSNTVNGFAYGKRMMDITVGMWQEDYRTGNLPISKKEFLEDYPLWFLTTVLPEKFKQENTSE